MTVSEVASDRWVLVHVARGGYKIWRSYNGGVQASLQWESGL